jgi:diguanylate cyclase (GGDEF)-like protein/PAS domain S-box-containing protein
MDSANSEKLYQQILDSIKDGVYFVDTERRILFWNKGAEEMTGFKAEQVLGSYCHDNILNHVTESGVRLCFGGCPLQTCMEDGVPRQAEVFLHHADGQRVPVLVRVSPMKDETGRIIGGVETFTINKPSIAIRRKLDQLKEASLHDPLTGIGNRRSMEMQMPQVLQKVAGGENPGGILFVDIDLFKPINDTYGHEIGDKVLRMVAQTLKNNIRAEDLLGRWGGDEFIIFLLDTSEAYLRNIAEKLRHLVAQSRLRIDGKEIGVTVSIGATLLRSMDTTHTVIERADKNMYLSKKADRNRVTLD